MQARCISDFSPVDLVEMPIARGDLIEARRFRLSRRFRPLPRVFAFLPLRVIDVARRGEALAFPPPSE